MLQRTWVCYADLLLPVELLGHITPEPFGVLNGALIHFVILFF